MFRIIGESESRQALASRTQVALQRRKVNIGAEEKQLIDYALVPLSLMLGMAAKGEEPKLPEPQPMPAATPEGRDDVRFPPEPQPRPAASSEEHDVD